MCIVYSYFSSKKYVAGTQNKCINWWSRKYSHFMSKSLVHQDLCKIRLYLFLLALLICTVSVGYVTLCNTSNFVGIRTWRWVGLYVWDIKIQTVRKYAESIVNIWPVPLIYRNKTKHKIYAVIEVNMTRKSKISNKRIRKNAEVEVIMTRKSEL